MNAPGLLFVCLGNVCRSPIAESVAKHMLAKGWPDRRLRIASCGTAAFNAGKPADPRAIAVLRASGYDPAPHTARQIDDSDFTAFGQIVAMDRANLLTLSAWAPATFAGTIRLLDSSRGTRLDFHSGIQAFAEVLQLIEIGVHEMLTEVLGPRDL